MTGRTAGDTTGTVPPTAPRPEAAVGTLVLVRHGQSTTNAEGRFTGWTDAPLTAHGEREALDAGRQLAEHSLLPEAVHTSLLVRSVHSAELLLREAGRSWIPVHRTWRLNERQYGALTGRRKSRVREEAGPARYRAWRRSLGGVPDPMPEEQFARLRADPRYTGLRPTGVPAAESLAGVIARVTPYWADVLAARLRTGGTVLVVAHGNSLRALAAVLDGLSGPETEELNIPTGAPLRYDVDAALRPLVRGGRYLNPERARAAAASVAAEGAA